MLDRARVYFERERLPASRDLDPADQETIDFDAIVRSVDARHGLSRLYRVDVELEVDQDEPLGRSGARGIDLDLAALRDRRAAVVLSDDPDSPLVYHGVVTAAEFLRARDHRAFYTVTLQPAIHRLSHRHDTRIFQHMSVPDIVAEVIGRSAQLIESHLGGDYPALDYLVQHQEHDLEFVLRLLEQEGIYFWFAHEPTRHVMHLADSLDSIRPIAGEGVLRYYADRTPHEDEIGELRFTTRIVHDVHVTRDWDWMRPNAPIEGEHASGSARRFERYEYPGRLRDESDARRRARRRQEESDARKYELAGVVRDERLLPGRRFTLMDARPAEINQDYLLTSIVHRVTSHADEAGLRARVEIEAIPATQCFRPARRTAAPRVHGRESAVVTGASGDEIHVDEFGCVKTHFYWDRLGTRDERSSRWIRVAQPNTVGSMYLPRVGWEVAVGYLDGDPGRPLLTHKLYNEEHLPPYTLPESLSYTTWKSLRTPGGGGHNELRLDDTNGGMELYIYAQRDLDTRVGNDRFEAVGINSTEDVVGRLHTSVAATETVTVGIDQVKQIERRMRAATGGTKTVTVAQLDSWRTEENHSITNDGNRTETVAGPMIAIANDATHTVHGTRDAVIGGAFLMRVSGSCVEVVGQSKQETVSGARVVMVRGAHIEDVGGSKTLSAGKGSFTTPKTFSVTGANLDLQVGGSLTHEIAENLGVNGSDVTVQGSSELRARAGGAELVLGGSLLDVDASKFSSSASLVRLLGQIEMIGGDSAEEGEPEGPGPEDDWIEITLLDANGDPVANERYVVRLQDGSERSGSLDGSGKARIDGIPPGTVHVSFPGVGAEAGAGE